MGIKVIINNQFTKFEGNPRALEALRKELSFRHPNAFYIRQKVKSSWDGMVNPLTKGNRIKTGLLEKALSILVDYEENYEVLDYRKHLEISTIPEVIGGLTLRPYQLQAVEKVVFHTVLEEPHRRGLLIFGVNAGKTLIFFAIHKTFVGAKTLLLVDNTVLYKQMVDDAKTVFGSEAGYMQGKNVKWGSFMVCMVKTLNNRLKDYRDILKTYNILLVDEADLGKSATHQSIYAELSHISVRIGSTGTAFMRELAKDRLRNMVMLEQFGNELMEITMKELEDMGVNTKAVIRILPGDKPQKKTFTFMDEFNDVISDNPHRKKRILKRILLNIRMGRKYIMVFNRFKQQTEDLYEYLKPLIPQGINIGYTHSDHKKGGDLDGFKNGTIHVLISSLYLKRGLNLPLIQVIINNSGGEFYANPLQILGRGVRKHSSKDKIFFEDFYDEGKYLKRHANRRVSYYKARNLTISDLRV